MDICHGVVAIIPCNDLADSLRFYEQLGFMATSTYVHEGYCILHDEGGASVHLTRTEPGWVNPERNAHGVYFYTADVEAIATRLGLTA